MSTPSQPDDFGEFLTLSARLGQDIRRTQGAGGNTSIKQDGIMWVKASGTWLAHALERDVMVPVKVEPLIEALRAGDPRAEKSTDFVVNALNSSGLRPSIETSFHAALPQKFVAHFHCVNTLALAVLERRATLLAERMALVPDLTWTTIPYRRPGTPLAREIDIAASGRPDVLILFNHGIIVNGSSVTQVEERIERVTRALTSPQRTPAAVDRAWLATKAEGTGFRLATDDETHATALDAVSMEIALGGSLYPDHVIFLGTSIGVLTDDLSVADLLADFAAKNLPAPKMLVAAGKGVLLDASLTPGGEAMARCLAEVVTRVPAGETITYLSDAQEDELSNWEAEQYRQALDRKAAAV